MAQPLASVIVLNWNGKRFLEKCIGDSLKQQGVSSYEIILVDNGSTDGSIEAVRKRYAKAVKSGQLRIIQNTKNEGFAEGNNIGARATRGRYVALLNNDAYPAKDWLVKMIAAYKRLKRTTKGPVVIGGYGLMKPSKKRLSYAKRIGTTLCGENVAGKEVELAPGIYRWFYVGGYALLYERKDFRVPFDKLWFAYAEDIYLCWQARLRGGEVGLALNARVDHKGGGTKFSDRYINKVAVFNGTKNQIMNYLIFYEWKNIIRIAPLFAITQLGHIIENPRKLIVKLKAYWWTFWNWPRIMRRRKAIQKKRKVSDKEIVALLSYKFYEPKYTPNKTRRALIRSMNTLFRWYCRTVGLKTQEF